MCLIIASQAGERPSEDLLTQAAIDNPDGWGLVWYDGKRLRIRKGLDTFHALSAMDEIPEGRPYVLHFRWSTHGRNTLDNCHPFKLGDWGYMAHNGVLAIPTSRNRGMSDTWHFAQYWVKPYLKQQNPTDDELLDMAEDFIGHSNETLLGREMQSKLAFLKADGKILIANETQGQWEDGIWYSNTFSHEEVLWAKMKPHKQEYQELVPDLFLPNGLNCDSCGQYSENFWFRYDSYICEDCYQESLLQWKCDGKTVRS